jgi:hypothetical protein
LPKGEFNVNKEYQIDGEKNSHADDTGEDEGVVPHIPSPRNAAERMFYTMLRETPT